MCQGLNLKTTCRQTLAAGHQLTADLEQLRRAVDVVCRCRDRPRAFVPTASSVQLEAVLDKEHRDTLLGVDVAEREFVGHLVLLGQRLVLHRHEFAIRSRHIRRLGSHLLHKRLSP